MQVNVTQPSEPAAYRTTVSTVMFRWPGVGNVRALTYVTPRSNSSSSATVLPNAVNWVLSLLKLMTLRTNPATEFCHGRTTSMLRETIALNPPTSTENEGGEMYLIYVALSLSPWNSSASKRGLRGKKCFPGSKPHSSYSTESDVFIAHCRQLAQFPELQTTGLVQLKTHLQKDHHLISSTSIQWCSRRMHSDWPT